MKWGQTKAKKNQNRKKKTGKKRAKGNDQDSYH